ELKGGNNERTVIPLDADRPTMITEPIRNPVATVLPVAQPPAAPTEPYIKQVEARSEEPVKEEPAPVQQAPQRTFEFVVGEKVEPRAQEQRAPEPEEEVKRVNLYEDQESETPAPPPVNANVSQEPNTRIGEVRLSPAEHQARVEQRVQKVRELNLKLRTPNGLADLEREPAYKRRNVQLSETAHSTESNISRYSLSEEVDEQGERRVELKKNNPYLHDNVD